MPTSGMCSHARAHVVPRRWMTNDNDAGLQCEGCRAFRVNIHETLVHQFTVMPTTMYMFDSPSRSPDLSYDNATPLAQPTNPGHESCHASTGRALGPGRRR